MSIKETKHSDKFHKSESLRRLSNVVRQGSFIEPVILNPFSNYLRLPWYEWVKVSFMSVTIAPVRFVLIVITFGITSIFASVGCLFSTESTFIGTLPWWRKYSNNISKTNFVTQVSYIGYLIGPREDIKLHPEIIKIHFQIAAFKFYLVFVCVFLTFGLTMVHYWCYCTLWKNVYLAKCRVVSCCISTQGTLRYSCRKLMRLIFFFCGFHYLEVRGRRANPNEAMILVAAPHSSFCDILAVLSGRTLSGISKIENSYIPGFGSLGKLLQPIWVNREDVNSRLRTVELLSERSKYAGKMPQIVVFPEGTTTNRTCLINFKAGAFIPGVPVQPVLIRFPNRVDCITWTNEQLPVLLTSWMMLCQFHNRCIVEYLPVYVPNEKEKHDAKLFGNNVRDQMARSLDVPVTDHSFEDVKLMWLAKKYNLPQAAGIVEFSKLSRKLTLNFGNISEFIKYFAEISRELKGKITIEAFAEYLGLPISPEVEKLFNMYDRNRTGYIDFREYVIGLSLVTMPANTEQSLRLAFEMLDPDKTGEVSEYEFISVMGRAFNMEYYASVRLFQEMDISKTGSVSYEDFIKFAKNKPEFIKVVSLYNDFQCAAKEKCFIDHEHSTRKEKLL